MCDADLIIIIIIIIYFQDTYRQKILFYLTYPSVFCCLEINARAGTLYNAYQFKKALSLYEGSRELSEHLKPDNPLRAIGTGHAISEMCFSCVDNLLTLFSVAQSGGVQESGFCWVVC